MEDVIKQMKRIQSRIGQAVDNSSLQGQPSNRAAQIVGGEGIEVRSDGDKVAISKSDQPQTKELPNTPSGGTYVLGAVGGSLQWIATTDCT